MKRLFDFVLVLIASLILLIPIVIVALLVRVTSPGPVLYWSDRVGRYCWCADTHATKFWHFENFIVATHLLADAHSHLTPVGNFLRKSSLDELPQLWSIICGNMSFVGPRPALFNQQDLIELRTQNGVDKILPGLTGWAQVNGRDELPIPTKVKLDAEYMQRQSLLLDVKIIFLTFLKVLRRDGITH